MLLLIREETQTLVYEEVFQDEILGNEKGGRDTASTGVAGFWPS